MRTTDWTLSHISFFPEAAQILETRLRSKRPALQAWFIQPLRLEANSSVSLDFAFLDSASPRTYRPVSTMWSRIKSSHLNPAAAHDQACLPPSFCPPFLIWVSPTAHADGSHPEPKLDGSLCSSRIHTHVLAHISIHINTCVYAQTYMYIHTCEHICVCRNAHEHTFIHM